MPKMTAAEYLAMGELRAAYSHEKRRAAVVDALSVLRSGQLSVAVHNDYRLGGEARTFWLFTHPSGRWFKGEGVTDAAALAEILTSVADWTPSTDFAEEIAGVLKAIRGA